MEKKTTAGLMVIVVIVAVMIFAGLTAEAVKRDKNVTTFSGAGATFIPNVSLEKGQAIFRMTHNENLNFRVYLLDDAGSIVDAWESGEFDGVKVVNTEKVVNIEKQGDYILAIEVFAFDKWTISIEQP